jgi:hypothetical protein
MDNGLADADHLALARLVTEAVWRVDHGLGHTTHDLYLEDAEVYFDGVLMMSGRADLEAWGKERPGHIRHVAANLRFEADGPDRAKGSGIEIPFFDPSQTEGLPTTIPQAVNEWTFKCARTPDGWRFSRIDVQRLFARPDEAARPFDAWGGTSQAGTRI